MRLGEINITGADDPRMRASYRELLSVVELIQEPSAAPSDPAG